MKRQLYARLTLVIGTFLIVSACASPSKKASIQTSNKPSISNSLSKTTISVSPTHKPAPEPIINAPNHLTGLNGNDVEALLGVPSFIRHDAPAQVWQYDGGICLLDVFLYGKGSDETLTVAHSEARRRKGAEMKQRDCMISLIKEKRTGPS